jgi:hypothetical protein
MRTRRCLSASPDPDQQIYGVTVDTVTQLSQIVASLARLPRRLTVRITFDPGLRPAYYAQAVDQISRVAAIMAQPVDSSEVTGYTTTQYVARFRTYLNAFSHQVALWEVGNEVNGNWLGPASTVSKDIEGAYDLVRRAGRQTALTLTYQPGCGDDMFAWAAAHIPAAMRNGLDYALVSYYAEDCNGGQPSSGQWTTVFRRLRTLFPHAKLGFGEVGTNQGDRPAYKLATLNRYYRLRIDVPGYIGGYFWWYYAQDMVPDKDNVLWRALSSVITSAGASIAPGIPSSIKPDRT